MKIDEQTGLYGNYGIWHKPFWQTTFFYRAGGLLIVASILLISYLLIKKYYARKKKRVIPVWQQALQELVLLQEQEVLLPECSKKFYGLLTFIFKSYLQEKRNLPLVGKTDAEVIAFLQKRTDIDRELLKHIETVFTGSVGIKFANERAMQEQIENDLNRSIAIIEKMQQQENER